MKFGEKLKDLRLKRKLTQDEVAASIGVSRRAYIAYEQENVRPRKQETYDKLAKVLGCDANYLRIDDSAFGMSVLAAIGSLGVLLGTSGFPAVIPAVAALLAAKETIPKIAGRSEDPQEPLTYTNDMLLQYQRAQRKFAATAMGILYRASAEKGIHCQQGNLKKIDGGGILPDDYVIVSDQEIEEWWFIFWAKDPELDEKIIVFPNDRAGVMVSRFTTAKCDPKRMASIVVDDIELYEAVCTYKEHNSYRGNLSVILVDTDEVRICKETIISLYDNDPAAKASYISIM